MKAATVLASILWLGSVHCDRAETTTSEESPRKKRRKKKKKRKRKDVAPTATTAAAPPPLPPASPTVRTDAPPDLNAPIGAEVTPSGLATRVLKHGRGSERVGKNDTVEVHYSGWTLDGKMFDSSVTRGKPAKLGVTKVIKGWTEGLQLMVEGERRRLWIPPELAYGTTPRRPGAPAGKLVFDVEVIRIIKSPMVPADLTKPPRDAITTKSGLVYRVMHRGTSTLHPTTKDKVTVHYSGWMLDGTMFDSSVTRGRPATFGVTGVIKGWTEVLQLMSPGDRFRVWIPPNLAYGATPKRPGGPSGKLIFDIELISVP